MRQPLPTRILSALLAAALVSPLTGQCARPAVPPGGLPTSVALDVPLTYSDGYKTLCNLTWPSGPAPSCGWPLVVFVHGYGGRRSVQRALASRGFAVLAQDVRGQGTARTLNPATMGMTFYGATEKYDLAELIRFARTRWQGLVSPTRLAVTGASQGGIHSWFAAAYSGRTITIAGRGTITFPKVDCVAPQNFIPDVIQHTVRNGSLFSIDAVNRAFGGNNTAVLDAGLVKLLSDAFLKQDPAGLQRAMLAEPSRAVAPLLASATVPVLYAHAWLDGIQAPGPALAMIETMPGSTPVRSILSTIGHGSPNNAYEAEFRTEERIRWFDRFLWDIRNGVETDAPAVPGVMPVDATLTNLATMWEHRFDPGYRVGTRRRHYLRADGTAGPTPGTAGADTTIHHQVAASFTPQFVRASPANWRTPTVLANVPLSERVFRAAPLSAEQELAGRPQVDLEVVPGASRFHLCVLLQALIPGQSTPRMLAIAGQGVPAATRNTPMRLRFELSPIYAVLPAASRLEVVVRNHWLREAPMARALVTMPYFESGTTRIVHGTGSRVSFVDLPFRDRRGLALTAGAGMPRTMPTGNPGDFRVTVQGDATDATRPYIIAVGGSGHAPATGLPGGSLPLRWDPLSDVMLGLALSNSGLVPGFVGTLDGSGRATATLRLAALAPLPAALAGQRLSVAAWVHAGPTDITGRGSNPLDLGLR